MSEPPRFRVPFGGRSLAIGVAIVLILGSVTVVFFNRLAAGNLILARGDTLLYFYPYWQEAAEALGQGRVPLWNPSLFMGAPFLANSQVGYFYPLNWPFWLLLPTPYAASYSILLHLLLASLGVYQMGRRCLSLTRPASLLAAVLFSLGGYLTAQVEHINQVQGIAWLPWYFVVLCGWRPGMTNRRRAARVAASMAAILSLQILSGHTQTVFISLVAIAIWLLVILITDWQPDSISREGGKSLAYFAKRAWLYARPVAAGGLLAALMTAVQLLPTFELSQHSLRQGGLPVNEVLSFSLQPLLLGQSLLPAYDRLVFTEYSVFLPITALLLAAIGARRLWSQKVTRPFLILAATGLFLALGRFNPLYYPLAQLPGFDLFRAPARWSVLYALIIALLAAAGWQALSFTARRQAPVSDSSKDSRALLIGVVLILLLVIWSIVSGSLAAYVPAAPEAVVERPTDATLSAWIGEAVLAGALLYLIIRGTVRTGLARWFILFGAIVVLFLSTRILPYNNPTTPEAYFDLRAPISRISATGECGTGSESCQSDVSRLLGLSDIFFDVGDQAEIDSVYGEQLGTTARFDYTVAIKQKEIAGPNLPLAYGLRSVDGFDGGVLPLSSYATLMRLVLPEGVQAFDGRLREHLDAIPEERWLDLFGARFIITDKVGDEWRQGVFFDMKHPVNVTRDAGPIEVGYLPAYEATELWFIADGLPGTLSVLSGESNRWLLTPELIEPGLWRVTFPTPEAAQGITLNPCQDEELGEPCSVSWRMRALALVDERDGTFMPILAGQYRLMHSGDVKVYDNLDVLARAFLVFDWRFVRDDESGLAIMQNEDFDPGQSAVVLGDGPPATVAGQGNVTFIEDHPERIVLRTESDAAALMLLTDAFYPGWQATVDGRPVPVNRTDILFRGVFVPAGEHEIVLEFRPASYLAGRIVTLIGLLMWIGLVVYAFFPRAVQEVPATIDSKAGG